MINLPGITFTLPQFSLGVQNIVGQVAAVVGPCATGSANSLYVCNSVSQVKNAVLAGPAAEVAANLLQNGNGGQVFIVPTSPAAAATSSSLTTTFASPVNVTCSYSASSAPFDTYSVIVNVVSGGTMAGGAPTLQYSFDGGNTYNPTVSLPTNGTLQLSGSGIGLNFTGAGSLTGGDQITFTTVAPGINTAVVQSALNALQVSSSLLSPFLFVAVVGQTGSTGTAASNIGTTIASTLGSWVNTFDVFTAGMFEANTSDTALNNVVAMNAIADTRTMACGGVADIQSALTGRLLQKRSSLYSIAPRCQASVGATQLNAVAAGGLPGVVALYDDQSQNSTYQNGRIAALRTLRGQPGFYVAQGLLLSNPGSDFSFIENRKVIDAACRVAFATLTQQIGASVVLNSNGTLATFEAIRIAGQVNQALKNALVGQMSNSQVVVDTTNNVAQTQNLNVTVQILPLGATQFINVTVAFSLGIGS